MDFVSALLLRGLDDLGAAFGAAKPGYTYYDTYKVYCIMDFVRTFGMFLGEDVLATIYFININRT